MKRLLGMVGCGSQDSVVDAVQKSTPDEAVAALEKLGAKIERNEQGDVGVDLSDTEITDAGLVYLKEMTKLENLELEGTQITDAGLVHLQGLTTLASLSPIHPGDRCGNC